MCRSSGRNLAFLFSASIAEQSKSNSTEFKAAWIQCRREGGKNPLFTKRTFEKLTRTLVFSNPAVTGKQATAVGTQRLMLGKHLGEGCIFYIAWLPNILADHHLPLSKIHCYNFLTLIECQRHQLLNRLSTFMIKWMKIVHLDISWVPTSTDKRRDDWWCIGRKSKERKFMISANPLFTYLWSACISTWGFCSLDLNLSDWRFIFCLWGNNSCSQCTDLCTTDFTSVSTLNPYNTMKWVLQFYGFSESATKRVGNLPSLYSLLVAQSGFELRQSDSGAHPLNPNAVLPSCALLHIKDPTVKNVTQS